MLQLSSRSTIPFSKRKLAIEGLRKEIESCKDCPGRQDLPLSFGSKTIETEVVFVDFCPTEEEVQSGDPFAHGVNNRIFGKTIRDRFKMDLARIGYIHLYKRAGVDKGTMSKCAIHTSLELEHMDAPLIVLLGNAVCSTVDPTGSLVLGSQFAAGERGQFCVVTVDDFAEAVAEDARRAKFVNQLKFMHQICQSFQLDVFSN